MDHPAGELSGDLATIPIVEVVQAIHSAGGTGTLEIDAAGQRRRLFFREGQLFLAATHHLARRLGELVRRLQEPQRGGHATPTAAALEARSQTSDLVKRMAQVIAEWRQGNYRFDGEPGGLPQELAGPLPTLRLIMLGSILGADEAALIARLGGFSSQLVARESPPELDALGLAPEEIYLVERLSQPMTVQAVLSESPVPRLETLQKLVQLKVAAQVRILGRADSGARVPPTLNAELVRKLDERFARDLRDEPLKLPVEEYRRRISDLIGRLGGMNAYELLDVETSASADSVQAKYEELARLTHPLNEANYGLTGLSPMLSLLFERATEAYLALSDPERRRRYNEDQEIDIKASTVTGARREVEQQQLARQYYEQALAMAARGDFHFAVELLGLAVKLDRKVDYFLALARLQAKNPKWAGRAVDTCRAALELDAHNPDVRYQLGELYEQLGDLDRARAQYTAAARENPNHAQAAAKLRHFSESAVARKGGGLFDRLFGRRDTE